MPSAQPLPSVADLLRAAGAEITLPTHNTNGDLHRGSNYDVLAGVGAVLFSREATRDRDLFRADYFDYAENTALDTILQQRFNTTRVLDAPGTGVATFSRPTAGGGAGTLWGGTRFSLVQQGVDVPKLYTIASDTPVGASTTLVPNVPIQSVKLGTGVAVASSSSYLFARFEDVTWDPTWTIQNVVCGDGTIRETDPIARARVRTARRNQRVGYVKAITDACVAAGAVNVALFASDYLGTDFGLNRCYVGDAFYNATPTLLTACRIAVDSARVLGADMPVFGMSNTAITLNLTVRVWNDISKFDQAAVIDAATKSILNYFGARTNAFTWKQSAVRGAIMRVVTDVQSVDFSILDSLGNVIATSTSEPVLANLFNGATLARYYATASNITINLTGPA